MKHTRTSAPAFRPLQAGFTLVELLVTIVILAVIATLGIPSLSKFLREWQRDNVSREFMAAVQTARAEAIKSSRKVILCPSSDGSSCANSTSWKTGWLAFVDTDGNGSLDADERIITQRSTEANVSSMTSSDDVRQVVFLPNGLAGSGNTEITVIPYGGSSLKRNKITVRMGRATLVTEAQE